MVYDGLVCVEVYSKVHSKVSAVFSFMVYSMSMQKQLQA